MTMIVCSVNIVYKISEHLNHRFLMLPTLQADWVDRAISYYNTLALDAVVNFNTSGFFVLQAHDKSNFIYKYQCQIRETRRALR